MSSPSFIKHGCPLALAGISIFVLSGCLGDVTRSMVRDENDGVGGTKVYDVQIPYYQPSKLLPAGVTSFSVAHVPKSYDLLLDLNMDPTVAKQRAGAAGDVTWWSGTEARVTSGSDGLNASVHNSNRSIADNPYAQYGAAAAIREMRARGSTFIKQALAQKVDQGGQVELHFTHEVVEIGQPNDEAQLEPFGKVLSVTTNNEGEMISQSREPVYTLTIPSQHRLVVTVKEPVTGKELSKAVYATWSKDLKYYRNADKKFFASSEEALASYDKEKSAFADIVANGPLFEAKRPKNLKELPAVNLSVMSPEDVYGVMIKSDNVWLMLPAKGDKHYAAISNGLGAWVQFEGLSAHLKPQFIRDASWITKAEHVLEAVVSDKTADKMSRAVAYLNLATLAGSRLDAQAATDCVAKAKEANEDVLGNMNWVGSGGAFDYGKYYYQARDAWLGIGPNVTGVATRYKQGVNNAVINPGK